MREPVADHISDSGSCGSVTLILSVCGNNRKHVFLGFDYEGLT